MTIDAVKIWNWLKGKKTYAVGIAAIIYGVYEKNPEIIITGLGLMGIRNALATEVANLAK